MLKNIMNAPSIENRKPNILNPIEASFWSPKLNSFLVSILASNIQTTPTATMSSPYYN